MNDKKNIEGYEVIVHQELDDNANRRLEDRRTSYCEGYTYVSSVGWICRREQSRRKCKNEEHL